MSTITFPTDEHRVNEAVLTACAQELADWINEQPEHIFHFGHDDVREAAYRVLSRARQVEKAVTR